MKKYITTAVVLLLTVALFSSGCSYDSSKSSAANSMQTSNSKEQLVWVVNSEMLQSDAEVYNQLNTLLAKKGCDFTVKFKGVDFKSYADTLKKMKSSGEQADIIFSDIGNTSEAGEDSGYSTYYNNVKNGYYAPLDEYLSSSKGSKLYKAFDERCWNALKIGGKIYSVTSESNMGTIYTWQFNEELLKKYNIDIAKLSVNLWDMSDILKTVYEGEKSDKSFAALYIPSIIGGNPISTFYDNVTDCVGVLYSDSSCKAVNLFAEENTVKHFKALKQFKDAGYLKIGCDDAITNFFVTDGGYKAGNIGEENSAVANNGDKEVTIKTTFKQINDGYVSSDLFRYALNGIASWSKNKDKAFELLTLVNTDPEISNLLTYGINNRNYVLKDGYVTTENMAQPTPLLAELFFGNSLINYPCEGIGIYKDVDYNAANKALKSSPILGFFFDESKVKNEVAATDKVLANYQDKLYKAEEADADATIAQLQSELKAAGIDKVVAEVNHQITDWKKSK